MEVPFWGTEGGGGADYLKHQQQQNAVSWGTVTRAPVSDMHQL